MEKNKTVGINHRVFNILIAVQVVAIWVYALYLFKILPDIVPMHFSAAGKADRLGSKSEILVIPFLFTFLAGFLSFIRHADVQYNIPFRVTKENKDFHYRQARKFVGVVTIYLNFLAIYILYSIQNATQGEKQEVNVSIALVPLGIIILSYYLITKRKANTLQQ